MRGLSVQYRVRKAAFTLAELLVVIAIIVVLLTMLTPFLGDVRERGYLSLCQNNLNKIGQAMARAGSEKALQGTREAKLGRRPTGADWLLAATNYGSGDILLCPKGSYRGGGGDVQTSANINVIDAPDSAQFNMLEDNNNITMFQERAGLVLPSPVSVDIISPGQHSGMNRNHSPVGTIPAGTMVDSYFLHYDSLGSQGITIRDQKASFSTKILGIICTDHQLDNTDQILGSPETVYDTGRGARGFESVEKVTLSQDRHDYVVDYYQISFPGEDARILTEPGGEASYGINNLVDNKWSRPDQLYIVEYQRSMISVDSAGWEAYSAPRHFNKSNGLFWDGSVKLLTPEEYDPRNGYWSVQPPPKK